MSTPSASTGAIEQPRLSIGERFAQVSEGDYVRDALAFVLLAVSLALPTKFTDPTHGIQDPLFLGVVAIAALALVFPYVSRFGLLPRNWTVARTRAVRLILALPFVALFLWEAIQVQINADGAFGIGSAFALGGAGVALAAQARKSELGPVDQDKQAAKTARICAAMIALLIAAGYIATAVRQTSSIEIMVLVLAGAAIVLLPVVGVAVKRTKAWISFNVGFAIAVCAFIYLTSANAQSLIPQFETITVWDMPAIHPLSLNIGMGLFLIPAFGAVVSSPAFSRVAARGSKVEERLDLVAIVVRYMLVVGLMFAVSFLALSVFLSETRRNVFGIALNQTIAATVAGLVISAVAFIALRSFNNNPGTSRAPVSIALALSAALALVISALSPFVGLSFGHLMLMLLVPGLGAYALIGNKESRQYFAAASKGRPEPAVSAYTWTADQLAVKATVNGAASTASEALPATPVAPTRSSVLTGSQSTLQTGSQSTVTQSTDSTSSQAHTQNGQSAATGTVTAVESSENVTGVSADDQLPQVLSPEVVSSADVQDSARLQNSTGQSNDSAQSVVSTQSPSLSEEETQVIHAITGSPVEASAGSADSATPVHRPHSAPTQAIDRAEVLAYEDTSTGSVSLHGYTEAEALNPATPAIVLAKIAELAPELHPALAKNPSTYPALVEWLRQLDDPAVNQALKERN